MFVRASLLLFAVVAVLLPFSASGDNRKCVQCANCATDYPAPEKCFLPVNGCMKTVLKIDDKETVTRGCSPKLDDDKKCAGDSCIYFCDTDGCNSAPPAAHHSSALHLLLLVSVGLLVAAGSSFV